MSRRGEVMDWMRCPTARAHVDERVMLAAGRSLGLLPAVLPLALRRISACRQRDRNGGRESRTSLKYRRKPLPPRGGKDGMGVPDLPPIHRVPPRTWRVARCALAAAPSEPSSSCGRLMRLSPPFV